MAQWNKISPAGNTFDRILNGVNIIDLPADFGVDACKLQDVQRVSAPDRTTLFRKILVRLALRASGFPTSGSHDYTIINAAAAIFLANKASDS